MRKLEIYAKYPIAYIQFFAQCGIGLVAKMVIHNSRARVLKDIPVYTGAKFSLAPNYKLFTQMSQLYRHR